MELDIVSSGSHGNCYVIQNEPEALVLEAGVRLSDLKKTLGFNVSKVNGVLITHGQHQDHGRYLKDYINYFPCYSHKYSFDHYNIISYNANIIENKKTFKVGDFQVMPFSLIHDVECFGYLINHKETGNILFVTDTKEINYSFDNLTNIIIEANYDEDIIDDNYYSTGKNGFLRDRVKQSHLSLDKVEQFLLRTDLSKVLNIVLIHLSNQNAHALEFRDKIERLTGKIVTIAEKNTIINLKPF